ncbi:2,3-bisphosphoglycerate-independent phosphoglycerate mutase [Patescibacteria group bacterium]|nr:2,3-bisphosphoglycerate-independent phosphoglycerate mutase [Patescibacteria group bacterium]MBU1673436.1 2,3-bisphosphoglycerate-independent phosphoglycerate mutase [Patescibacteria group bacterium]MBU1963363.1 2,3-bisphosphoglycerate-independent phosphoglycerate mutase [Patescibacteria group bacterium]
MKPLALIILDGWGIAPHSYGNAITLARTPVMDKLEEDYPHTRLIAHGEAVGLVKGQDGNSEAGHMNIGAGRVVEQEVAVINRTIQTGEFFKNPAFMQAINHVKRNKSRLHIMGLLSNHMSAHSYPEHLYSLIDFVKNKGIKDYYFHLFTDGRDSPQHLAVKLLELLEKYTEDKRIATIMGRYYAMERNKRWKITEKAYHAMTIGEGRRVDSAEDAIVQSYNRGETDEFIRPAIINKEGLIKENDAVIFFNLRSDRARQLTKCFVQKQFNKKNPSSFKRKKTYKNLEFIAMTDFGPDLDHVLTAFPAPDLKGTLPFAFKNGMKQVYLSESEKYAHVTYFFNGGYDHAVNHENRVEVKSPDVKSYDLEPKMSALKITRDALIYLRDYKYDFVCMNYANPDMVGHTGNLEASIKAVETVDKEVGRMVAAVKKLGGAAIITADHGNAEEMINLKTKEIDTKHSIYPVPFIITKSGYKLKKGGKLGNIAPTVLDLMGVKQPKDMTCQSLIC